VALALALLFAAYGVVVVVQMDAVTFARALGVDGVPAPAHVTHLMQISMLCVAAFAMVLPALVLTSKKHFVRPDGLGETRLS
jgi:hypothetical protein